MATVVIAAPISDRPTSVSGAAGRQLHQTIQEQFPQHRSVFIPDDQAIHEYINILKQYASTDNVLFEYYGHGLPDMVCGLVPHHCGGDRGGMVDTNNVDVLKGIVTHATSCWTSVELGRLAESIGVKAYVGHRAPCNVAFKLSENNYEQNIINVWNSFAIAMLNGGTVAHGIRAMDMKSKEYEDLYSKMKQQWEYADYYSTRFRMNINSILPYANLNATI